MHRDPTFEMLADQEEIDQLSSIDRDITQVDIESISERSKFFLTGALEIEKSEVEEQIRYMDSSPDGWVYFLSDGDLVKIGWSTNLGERLAKLQTGNARPLTLLFAISAESIYLEGVLHKKFAHQGKRRFGEWFALTEDDMDKVKSDNAGKIVNCGFRVPRLQSLSALKKAKYKKTYGPFELSRFR